MKYDTGGTTPTLAGIKWSERYGCYEAQIARWLVLSFSCSDGAYKVVVAGKTIVTRGKEPEDAAKIAVSAARKLLANAVAELPKEDESAQI